MAEEKRRDGIGLIDLTVSNPTEAISAYPHEQISQAYGQVRDFTYRPDPFGEIGARAAVSDYYRQRGVTVDPDRIAITASTSEAYSLLFKLFCNPGDQVLVPTPSYPLFEYLAGLEGVGVTPYLLRYDGSWFIDFAHLREQFSARTRAVVLVNPNNPTGSFLKRAEWDALGEIAGLWDVPIISDEVFLDFGFEFSNGPGSPLIGFEFSNQRLPTLAGQDAVPSFSLGGLSKAAGMPQMKLGWIVVNGPPEFRNLARRRLELVLDSYLSVGTPVQRALPELLRIGDFVRSELRANIRTNLSTLSETLRDSPAHVVRAEGGWSAIIQLPNIVEEEVWVRALLRDFNVLVQPGYFFDLLAWPAMVVSLIVPPAEFAEGVSRIRRMVSDETS